MSRVPGDPGRRAGWCVHYRYNRDVRSGSSEDTCEAGVDYARWQGVLHARQPCFLDERGQSRPDAMQCEHLRRPTTEEIALHERWMRARIDRMGVVMTAIAPWRAAHRGRSAREIITCPVCGGRLSLSVATNGHVHGRCETTDCVSWME